MRAGSNHDSHSSPFRGHDTPTHTVLPAGLADRGISQAFRRQRADRPLTRKVAEQPAFQPVEWGPAPGLDQESSSALQSY